MASDCTTGLLCCCSKAQADNSEDRAAVIFPVFPIKVKNLAILVKYLIWNVYLVVRVQKRLPMLHNNDRQL